MAVQHRTVSVAATATDLTTNVTDTSGFEGVTRTVVLQNGSAVTIHLGGSGVTAASRGYDLVAGAEASFDLTGSDVLYGVVASGTASLRVLHLGV